MTLYWLRGSAGYEATIPVADDGTVLGADLARALSLAGLGPWTVIDRTGGQVRYLGLIDRSIIGQHGARLCDLGRPIGRFQLLGQLMVRKEG